MNLPRSRTRVIQVDVPAEKPKKVPGLKWEQTKTVGDCKIRRWRIGNVIHIEKTIEVERELHGETYQCYDRSYKVKSAIIPYKAILAKIKIEPDDIGETPWQNCDGWEHTKQDLEDFIRQVCDTSRDSDKWSYDELKKHFEDASNHARVQGRDPNVRLLFDDPGQLTGWEYYHKRGASKQVAREMAAHHLKSTHETLVKWYEDGWEWWYVQGEFMGVEASCGGVDDSEYAEKEVKHDVASEIAYGVEKLGYTVRGRPRDSKKRKREIKLIKLRRQLHEQVPGSEFNKYYPD